MIWNLSNSNEKDKFITFCKRMINTGACVEIKQKFPNRSLRQNAYLHLIIAYFAIEYGCSKEEAKVDFFKRASNSEIFIRQRLNKQNKTVQFLRSTADLSTQEMTQAIESFRYYSSSVASIYLPPPTDKDFLFFIEQQIELNRTYL